MSLSCNVFKTRVQPGVGRSRSKVIDGSVVSLLEVNVIDSADHTSPLYLWISNFIYGVKACSSQNRI